MTAKECRKLRDASRAQMLKELTDKVDADMRCVIDRIKTEATKGNSVCNLYNIASSASMPEVTRRLEELGYTVQYNTNLLPIAVNWSLPLH